MYFTPVKSPVFNYRPDRTSDDYSTVIRTNHDPYMSALGLESLSGQLEMLSAWVRPKTRVEIHRDIDPQGIQVPWTIVLCPTGTQGLVLEIYQPVDPNKTEMLLAPSKKHSIPFLNKENATLVEEWSLEQQGSAIFSPGYYWHSIYNNSDQWQNCVSIRSNRPAVLEKIKKIFDKIW